VQLWPGYFTSINPNTSGIVLIADVAHKVLRTGTRQSVCVCVSAFLHLYVTCSADTVLDNMYEIMEANRHLREQAYREIVMSQLIGQIVLTRYNNRTYRIDDIAWYPLSLSLSVC
jgi:aubergine-like protein